MSGNDYKYLVQNLNLFRKNCNNLPITLKNLNYSKFLYLYGNNDCFNEVCDLYVSSLILLGKSVKTIFSSDLKKACYFDKNKQYREKNNFIEECLAADVLYIKDTESINHFNIGILNLILGLRIKKGLAVIITDKTSKYGVFNYLRYWIKGKRFYQFISQINKNFYSLEIHKREYKPFLELVKRKGNVYFYRSSYLFRKIGRMVFASIKRKLSKGNIISDVINFVREWKEKPKNKKIKIDLKEVKNIVVKLCESNKGFIYNKP